jgi:hypothetical protein
MKTKWVPALLLVVLAVGADGGHVLATPSGGLTSTNCEHLRLLKNVFPRATVVRFQLRRRIAPRSARGPIWPGRCGAFGTTYLGYRGTGASVDVSVTLYKTRGDLTAPLAEPAYGPVQRPPNGGRVRTGGPLPVSVNGAPGTETGVVSAYRNIFISSVSISLARTPVPISAQLRIHHRIKAAFRALG